MRPDSAGTMHLVLGSTRAPACPDRRLASRKAVGHIYRMESLGAAQKCSKRAPIPRWRDVGARPKISLIIRLLLFLLATLSICFSLPAQTQGLEAIGFKVQ